MTPTSQTGPPALTRAELVGTLGGMLLTLLLAALDQTIVGTAMPRIIAQLHGFERYAWVTAAYLVGSTIAVPVFARISDLYGRKKLFIGGVLLFITASACCGAAGYIPLPLDGMNQLIAFRALQGVGGGIITGLIFTIVGDIFSPAERAKYQGLFAALIGVASIIGPALGGWITDHLSWRWTFFVNLPVGMVAVAVLGREFPDIRPFRVQRPHLDWKGIALLCSWLVPLLVSLTLGGQLGWSSMSVGMMLAFAALSLAGFLYVESRACEPLMPFSLARDPVILICALQMFILGSALFGVVIYLPLFVQGVLGASATGSGSLLTPMMLTSVLMSILSGQILGRFARYRAVAVVGSAAMLGGVLLLARMGSDTPMHEVLRNTVFVGLGFGLIQPLYTLAVQAVAPRGKMGAATAAAQFSRSIGSTVGVAVFGSVLLLVYRWRLEAVVGPGLLHEFGNPLRFREVAPGMQHMPDAVREALAAALRIVFGSAAGLLGISTVLNLFLPAPKPREHGATEHEPAVPVG